MTDLDRIPLTVTWISVEHSLPHEGGVVLVAYGDGEVGHFHPRQLKRLPKDVTHWMTWPVHPQNVVLE